MPILGLGSSKVHDDSSSAFIYLGACGLVWSMLVALGAIDPGSNPGRPTTSFSCICSSTSRYVQANTPSRVTCHCSSMAWKLLLGGNSFPTSFLQSEQWVSDISTGELVVRLAAISSKESSPRLSGYRTVMISFKKSEIHFCIHR